jgi:glycerophosphoryl diester phosphodiesterase
VSRGLWWQTGPPVQQRLPSLLPRPILFAHRGARAHAPENTIEAFALALRLGATGLESDVWLTSDGIPVLDHDGEIKAGLFRKRPIGSILRSDLPGHIPSLLDLFEACGTDYQLSLDLKDESSGPSVIATIRHHAPELLPRTWLCDHDVPRLVALRPIDDDVKLVHSSKLARMAGGPERHAADIADRGIDAVNMRGTTWNGGLVTLFHRFDRVTFGWDVQQDHQLEMAIRMGLDGIFCDFVDRMLDAAVREGVA